MRRSGDDGFMFTILLFYMYVGLFVPRLLCFLFFFFKQKTAYDIRLSLVGSEMCIRDRYCPAPIHAPIKAQAHIVAAVVSPNNLCVSEARIMMPPPKNPRPVINPAKTRLKASGCSDVSRFINIMIMQAETETTP